MGRQQYKLCSSKDDKPLSRWINMANRLNYLNPNTTNNHEQQIYRLRSRVVGNRQANEKMSLL
jgi:hypothetical protein